MKIRKNVGMAIGLAAVAAVTLAGCSGGGGAEAGGDTTLTLLVPSYSDNTKALWEDEESLDHR
jgi:multiple sugar transport system substrate-binding protein